MLHRIFVKEGAAPELLRCIAARMHYPYLGQNKFEILTYRPRITKYAALLFPVSVQYPNIILCICHENGTDNPYPSKFEKADFSPTDSTYKNYMLFPTEDDADLYLQLKQDWTELRRLTSSFTTQFQFTPDNIRKLHEFVEFLQNLMTEKDNRD